MGCRFCRGIDPAEDNPEAMKFFDHEDNECQWDDPKRDLRIVMNRFFGKNLRNIKFLKILIRYVFFRDF